jgi:hypothetical protein
MSGAEACGRRVMGVLRSDPEHRRSLRQFRSSGSNSPTEDFSEAGPRIVSKMLTAAECRERAKLAKKVLARAILEGSSTDRIRRDLHSLSVDWEALAQTIEWQDAAIATLIRREHAAGYSLREAATANANEE